MHEVGSVAPVGSWWRKLVPVFWWVGLYLFFLVGRAALVLCFGLSVNSV